MSRILIAAAIMAMPLIASQPASAEVIYPWCLHDSRGGVNCGFVNQRQCMVSKTGNSDMCMLNGLYFRGPVRFNDPRGYSPKRYRYVW
jgi:hypothetical protein